MKYWIFQNNQVLGPYTPEEMGKISVFSPESLVCPEGRRGTSMGDWQRAGMVPDLSVALVRANADGGGKTAVLSIAGLPPEPTLKDLAQLGSIQEKISALEDFVLRLQDGLRAKDSELSSMHQELASKSLETGEIKSEAAARQREAEELKRQIAGLEERLASVSLLSETLDKAVEVEKRVEHDVEKQGQTLTDLMRDVESLRHGLEEAKLRQTEVSAPPPSPFHESPPPLVAVSASAAPMEFPIADVEIAPSFGAPAPVVDAPQFDPLSFDVPSSEASAPVADVEPTSETAPPRKSKKVLLVGAALGLAALGTLAFVGGYVPGRRKPKAHVAVLEPAPLPPPEPAPVPTEASDARRLAVELAKAWPLSGNRTLEGELEKLAPSGGNLSPWMADPLAGGRVQVNYFARGSAPGAPTIAYEFEVDLDGMTLVGRNAAARAVLTGKTAPPPAPPKAKTVKVKAKAVAALDDDSLEQMLGDEPQTMPLPGFVASSPKAAAPPAEKPRAARANPARRAAKAKEGKAAPADESLLDDLLKE